MLRRAGRQYLFDEDEDRWAFLRILEEVFGEFGVETIAWCLMDNHVHLVVFDPENHLSAVMMRVTLRYAQRYNRRSGHVGHVFQNRFRSKPIETDEYLLEAVRYVHNNPVEIGASPADYPWSSYSEYTTGRRGISSTALVLDMIGGPSSFDKFLQEGAGGSLFPGVNRASSDEDVRRAAQAALGCDAREIGSLRKEERDEKIRLLGEAGLSIRQIERLTGIGRNTVARALAQARPQ